FRDENLPHSPVLASMVGVDLGVIRDRSVISLVQLRYDGIAVVEDLLVFTPSPNGPVDLREVEADTIKLAQEHNATVIYDPWQSVLMAQRIAAAGVPVIEYHVSAESRAKLFSRLLDVIRNTL